MKRKHIRSICIAAIAAILVAACCMALLNSTWMHKKYGYGQDAIETEEMLEAAYRRDAEEFDALVSALCEYRSSGRLRYEEPRQGYQPTGGRLCYEDHRLFQLFYDENEGKSISIPLDDPLAQGICDGMGNLADWDEVHITFETDGMSSTAAIQSINFSMMLNTASVPWSKSYVDLNMRCYLNGRPAVEDKWYSGGKWLDDRWVIVCFGLV